MHTISYTTIPRSYPLTSTIAPRAATTNTSSLATIPTFGASFSIVQLHETIASGNIENVSKLLDQVGYLDRAIYTQKGDTLLDIAFSLKDVNTRRAMIKLIILHILREGHSVIVEQALKAKNTALVKAILEAVPYNTGIIVEVLHNVTRDDDYEAVERLFTGREYPANDIMLRNSAIEVACLMNKKNRNKMIETILLCMKEDKRMDHLTLSTLSRIAGTRDPKLIKKVENLIPKNHHEDYYKKLLESTIRMPDPELVNILLQNTPHKYRQHVLDHGLSVAEKVHHSGVYSALFAWT